MKQIWVSFERFLIRKDHSNSTSTNIWCTMRSISERKKSRKKYQLQRKLFLEFQICCVDRKIQSERITKNRISDRFRSLVSFGGQSPAFSYYGFFILALYFLNTVPVPIWIFYEQLKWAQPIKQKKTSWQK